MKRGFYRSARRYQIADEVRPPSARALQAASGRELEIFFGWRRARRLGLPDDADDPPAFAVVHELNAVDAARERLRVVRLVAALLGGPGGGDVGVGFPAGAEPI